jgi:hypothetical protein
MKLSIALSLIASASAFTLPSKAAVRTQLANDLWKDEGEDGGSKKQKEMSQALPFVERPKLLDGSLPGDVGFEYVC